MADPGGGGGGGDLLPHDSGLNPPLSWPLEYLKKKLYKDSVELKKPCKLIKILFIYLNTFTYK